jgi:hypothetical protein
MITLNIDRALVTVESWSDIESRPGFVRNLDPSQHTLRSIIGRYEIKDEIHCGLSNCHQPHARGYIVLTKSGSETNIGKDCGKKYFGVEFETLSRKYDRDMRERENRDALVSFSFQLDDIEATVKELRESSADWVYKKSRALKTSNDGCPDEIVNRIKAMIRAQDNLLTRPREATEEEVDAIEVRENRQIKKPHYIDEPIGQIAGLVALYPENDLKQLLVLDLEANFKKFREEDVDTMNYDELLHWRKWAYEVEGKIEKAREIIAHGQSLLDEQNLNQFLKVLKGKEDTALLRGYLRGLNRP